MSSQKSPLPSSHSREATSASQDSFWIGPVPKPSSAPQPAQTQDFGGVVFDFDRNSWSACDAVEADGLIDSCTGTMLELESSHASHIIDCIAPIARACGMVHIFWNGVFQHCSGFFISPRLFLTVHHAIPSGLLATERSSISHFCTISRSRHSPPNAWTKRSHSCNFVFSDAYSDICILSVDEPSPAWVKTEALIALSDAKMSGLIESRLCAIGYNGATCQERFGEALTRYTSALSPPRRWRIQCKNVPNFEEMFLPYQKSLAIGRFCKDQPGARRIRHTVPAWYGFSGAPIVSMQKNGVRILGNFQGGSLNDSWNLFNPFSADTIAQITQLVLQHQ